MAEIPKQVKLSEEDAKTLLDLNLRVQSAKKTAKMAMEEIDNRLLRVEQDTMKFWEEAAKRYNLDIIHVNYVLSPDGKHAAPLAMRFEAE